MNVQLNFDYKAICPSSFTVHDGKIFFQQKDEDYFVQDPERKAKLQEKKGGDLIVYYQIEADELIEICELFPITMEALQSYAVMQTDHLNETRLLKQHLHTGNSASASYRKTPIHMEKRVDADSDLSIKVRRLREEEIEEQTTLMIE